MFQRPDRINENLYVITPVFNSRRFRIRWKHYEDFAKHIIDGGAHLITIEASLGERSEVVKEILSDKHTIIHVRTEHEIWIKENLINIAVTHLPEDWKYMAWIDADIKFIRPDWVGECLHQLQHHEIIQMFSIAIDVDSNYNPFSMSTSFCHDYINGLPENDCYNGKWRKPNNMHTGYAWAIKKQAFRDLGGLIDFAILGSSDNHMSKCLIGEWEKSVNGQVHPEYKEQLKIWQERALKYIKRNIGYMDGGIIHNFHGAKENRRYKDRWKILVEHQFQPSLDLKKDWNGLYQLTDRNWQLKRDIQQYFNQRNEDSPDMKGLKTFAQQ